MRLNETTQGKYIGEYSVKTDLEFLSFFNRSFVSSKNDCVNWIHVCNKIQIGINLKLIQIHRVHINAERQIHSNTQHTHTNRIIYMYEHVIR